MSEAQKFNFELVSPEEKLMSEMVAMAVIPGEEGDIGVLPNHSALVSSLRAGVIEIFANDNETPEKIFVGGGFADISETNCTVLAEDAVRLSHIDLEALETEIKNLEEDLNLAEGAFDIERIERKLTIAKAKQEAVKA